MDAWSVDPLQQATANMALLLTFVPSVVFLPSSCALPQPDYLPRTPRHTSVLRCYPALCRQVAFHLQDSVLLNVLASKQFKGLGRIKSLYLTPVFMQHHNAEGK